VAASLVIGAGVAVWFGMSEATARRGESAALAASRASEDRARQISKLVVDALQSSDPNAGGRQDTTVAQAMRGAIAEIDSGAFSRDPTTEADLRETIGEILLHNGQPAESAGQFERALGLRRRGAGGSHELAVSLNNLGTAQIALGKFGEAEKNIRESLELHRHEPTVDEAAVASNLDNIGIALQGQEKFEGALQATTEALGIYRRLHPGDNADVARSLTNIGYVLRSLGRLEEAGDKLSESLTMLRRLHPEGHPDVALCLNGLAGVRRMMGRLDEAEPLYREALEMRRRAYKGDHPDVAASLANFGMFLASRGRPAEAVPLLREALEMDRRMLPRDHTDTLTCMNNLGAVLLDTKAYGEAEGLFYEALGMSRRLAKEKNLGEDNEDTANALMGLGRARQGLGKRDEARTALDESVAIQRRMAGTEPSYGLVRALYRSGCVRLENGEKDAARRDLEEAVVIGEKVLGAGDPQLKVFREAVEKCK
jgi:tetratricopeptide (TPR) repeat protein